MFFCPNCNFLLDITKNTADKGGNPKNKQIVIKKVIDLINAVINDDDSNDSNLKILFTEKDLLKNREYKKLDSNDQKAVLAEFKSSNIETTSSSMVILSCNKCGHSQKLKPGTVVFKGENQSSASEDMSVASSRPKDNTLPRTKDYICPNSDCESHKKSQGINKEAIFYRPVHGSYALKYMCTLCNTIWNP